MRHSLHHVRHASKCERKKKHRGSQPGGRLMTISKEAIGPVSGRSRRVAARLGELLLAAGGGRALALRGRGLEVEVLFSALFLADRDLDQVLALEAAAQDLLGQRVLDVLLDRATQRASTKIRIGALVDQKFL